MRFTWDPEKEKTNKRKHKVSFLEACYVFADKFMLTMFDDEHSEDEDRWITIGQSLNGDILVINHTFRGIKGKGSVRLISARKAVKSEVKQYFERRDR